MIMAAPLFSGCGITTIFDAPEVPRGALLELSDIKQLHPGETTKKEAEKLLGSPTVHATFNDNTWIYVSLTKNLVPASFPEVDKQQVVVLDFNGDGVLQRTRVLGKKNAIHVSMVGDVTPTPGTNVSILAELLGNVGKYNPMNSLGSTFGGMGGMGGMNGAGLGGGLGNGPMQGYGGGGTGNTMR
ncbi:outer membrane protein assembly factor BamE [Formicincola oecophyllae]|uniref:Outer membrane protein assembly factor BamE n=2 Tax=Formicincola oecophyllae TaxID=2558361 RepID=A0A4Y6UAU3_9PROT|nr:outer membrane protein assembly factor BamE [Formicincola oecophyllae]